MANRFWCKGLHRDCLKWRWGWDAWVLVFEVCLGIDTVVIHLEDWYTEERLILFLFRKLRECRAATEEAASPFDP
jgi:hypothetical protein